MKCPICGKGVNYVPIMNLYSCDDEENCGFETNDEDELKED